MQTEGSGVRGTWCYFGVANTKSRVMGGTGQCIPGIWFPPSGSAECLGATEAYGCSRWLPPLAASARSPLVKCAHVTFTVKLPCRARTFTAREWAWAVQRVAGLQRCGRLLGEPGEAYLPGTLKKKKKALSTAQSKTLSKEADY